HDDQSGRLDAGHRDALLAVDRDGHLVAPLGQAPRQHVAIHLVVLDEKNLRHRESPRRRPTPVATSSRTSVSNSSAVCAPFWRIFSTEPFSRSRSACDTSLAVTTTTGMVRQLA